MKRMVLALTVLLIPALTFAESGSQQSPGLSGTSGRTHEAAISLGFHLHPSDAYGSPGLSALREASNVKINWTLSPTASANEQYSLIMASGDITDAPTLKLYTVAWLPLDTIIKANPSQYPNLTKYVLKERV
jgi:hypothetical protein